MNVKIENVVDVIDSENDVAIVDITTYANSELFDVNVKIKIGNCIVCNANTEGLNKIKQENERCYNDAMKIIKRKKLCVEW